MFRSGLGPIPQAWSFAQDCLVGLVCFALAPKRLALWFDRFRFIKGPIGPRVCYVRVHFCPAGPQIDLFCFAYGLG
jgi:hypothetical protein